MITEFGAFALILALVLSLAQVLLSGIGRYRRSGLLVGAGEGAALAAFGALALAFAALASTDSTPSPKKKVLRSL